MAWVQIAAAMLSSNSLRQAVDTHRASVHQTAKLVAALLRVARATAGLAESNGSPPPGLWLVSPAGWLPRTGISSGTQCSVIEYGLPLPLFNCRNRNHSLAFNEILIKIVISATWLSAKKEHHRHMLQFNTLLEKVSYQFCPSLVVNIIWDDSL